MLFEICLIAAAGISAALYAICFARPRSKLSTSTATIDVLPDRIRAWYRRGHFIDVWGHRVFCVHVACTAPQRPGRRPTFVLVHGYPSSSYDYAGVVDELARHGDVFTHDHIGFGFSSKPPPSAFCYSVFEHADVACAVWGLAGLAARGDAVFVAHDMGDSVLAEVLARRSRGLLPPSLPPSVFAGALFTNGGMRIRLANLRLGQRVLLTPVGPLLARVMAGLDPGGTFTAAQLRSIWAPTAGTDPARAAARNIAIADMLALALHGAAGGLEHIGRAARYLADRFDFEYRWDAALREAVAAAVAAAATGGGPASGSCAAASLPQQQPLAVGLLWGDSDAVSPLAIPRAVAADTSAGLPGRGCGCQLTVLPGVGHFLMLEAPAAWVAAVVEFAVTATKPA